MLFSNLSFATLCQPAFLQNSVCRQTDCAASWQCTFFQVISAKEGTSLKLEMFGFNKVSKSGRACLWCTEVQLGNLQCGGGDMIVSKHYWMQQYSSKVLISYVNFKILERNALLCGCRPFQKGACFHLFTVSASNLSIMEQLWKEGMLRSQLLTETISGYDTEFHIN